MYVCMYVCMYVILTAFRYKLRDGQLFIAGAILKLKVKNTIR